MHAFAKFLNKDYNCFYSDEFNEEIQDKLPKIKLKMLSYTPKIFSSCIDQPIFTKNILNNNLDIFKLLLLHSKDDEIVFQVCDYIEQFKKKFLFYFKNICTFDGQIEQMLLAKKEQIMKSNIKSSRFSLKILQNLPNSPGVSPLNPLDFNIERTESITEKPVISLKKVEEKRNEITEEDPFEREKILKKRLIEEMDNWLCYDGNKKFFFFSLNCVIFLETNVISFNENMALALKHPENLENFMFFIISPFKFTICEKVYY